MGNWSYNPTYRSYNPIYNWKGAHLVGLAFPIRFFSFGQHFYFTEDGWLHQFLAENHGGHRRSGEKNWEAI